MSLFYICYLALVRHEKWRYLLALGVLLFSATSAYSQPPGIIVTAAGTGSPGFAGDGGPASQAQLHMTFGLAVDSYGSIYIADAINYRIRKITMDGTITSVAGIGTFGFSGDGGPASQAKLDTPFDVTVDDAGFLYIADTFNHRIRRVDPDGIITTIAGQREFGYSGDDGPATQAKLQSPFGVSTGVNGAIYIADTFNHCIRRVGPDGTITTIAGNGQAGYSGDGIQATQAQLRLPFGVSVGSDGTVYIADTFNHRIRRVGPDGIITTIAGNGQAGYSGDGMQARESSLFNPKSVTIDENGDLYISDTDNHRVRRIGSDGIITTVLGDGLEGYGGDGGSAMDARLHEPYDFITDLNGSMYVSDSHNFRVRCVSGALRTLFADTNPVGLGASLMATEDVFGQITERSPIRRQYAYGRIIDLTAPGTASGLLFQKWTRNGHDLSPSPNLMINMTENTFLRAVYVVPPDTIPPALIGGLSLHWQAQAVQLQWEETPDQDLDVYVLFRNEGPNVSITHFLAALSESKTTYADAAVEFGRRYGYRLAVRDTAGNMSHLSAPIFITIPIPPDTNPPMPPAGLTAVGQGEHIDLTWTGSTASDLAGYVLYRSEMDKRPPDSSDIRSWLSNQSTRYADSTIILGRTYYYRIAAQDTAGNVSSFSRVSATVPLPMDTIPPPAPTQIKIFAVDRRVFLQWAASPAPDLAAVLIFREDDEQHRARVPRAQVPSSITAFIDDEVTIGQTYFYHLVAMDSTGNQSSSSEVVQATLYLAPDRTPPHPPTVPTAELIRGMITLNWVANTEPDLSDYLILKSEDSLFSLPDSLGWVTQTSFADSAVAMETTYYYRLVARDYTGNVSPPGDIRMITTPAPPDTMPPAPPQGITAHVANGRVLLQWQSSAALDLAAVAVLRNQSGVALVLHADTLAWTPRASYIDSSVQTGRIYAYGLIAKDSIGNVSDLSRIVHILVPLPLDTVSPGVQITGALTSVRGGEPHTITVRAYDNRAVHSVKIAYKAINAVAMLDTLFMKHQADSTYQAVLPGSVMEAPGVEIIAMACDEAGNSTKTNVQIIPVVKPILVISLFQNIPNPFNPSTNILFTLPQPAHVVLDVYNMLGQVVKTLINEPRPAGQQSARWYGRNNTGNPVASGLYIYRLQIETTVLSRKMVLLR